MDYLLFIIFIVFFVFGEPALNFFINVKSRKRSEIVPYIHTDVSLLVEHRRLPGLRELEDQHLCQFPHPTSHTHVDTTAPAHMAGCVRGEASAP